MAKRKGAKSRAGSFSSSGLLIVCSFFALIVWTGSRERQEPLFALIAVGVFGLILYLSWKIWPYWARWHRFRSLVLDKVDKMPGHEFEHYIACLLTHQGFRTTVTQGSGDLGVDIVAAKGNASYAVQCKRHTGNVSRSAVSDAVAGKHHYRCQYAMVVTNRYFTDGALKLAESTKCVLIDRDQLAHWVEIYRRG